MILSPKEKDIIKYIVKGKITDLLEYINVMFEFKRIQLRNSRFSRWDRFRLVQYS